MDTTDPTPPPAPAASRGKPKARRVLWVVGSVLLFLLLDYCFPHTLIYDDGTKDMTFYFLVVDAGTGRPVPDVKILLYGSRESQELWTGPDGQASIELTCQVSDKIRQGFVVRTSRKSIYYPHRTVITSKPGYRFKGPLELTELVGWGHVGDYMPPPAEVELDPE